MNKKIFILVFHTLGLLSCKKDSVTVRPEFIGFWYCDNNPDFHFYIRIRQDGFGIYKEIRYGGGGAGISGDARADDEKLKIGSNHHFTITEYPHQIDTATSHIEIPADENFRDGKKANWKMALKGPNFYLGDGVYNKSDY